MHDTPLGRIVGIRAETDEDTIERFGSYERNIRTQWQEFRTRTLKRELTERDKAEVAKYFEKMFADMFAR
jgi:hypothetical protein